MHWWRLHLAALGILALLFPVKAIHIAFYAVAGIYVAARWLLKYAFSHLEVERDQAPLRLFPGETATVRIRFRNPTVVPLAWLSGHDALPDALAMGKVQRWVLSLPPLGKEMVEYQVSGWHRGVYQIGPLHVVAGEPFGLYQYSKVVDTGGKVIIYPRVYPLAQLSLPSDLSVGQVRTAVRIHPDPARIAGVRPYQAGDTWQSIHWKATARVGELQVKQYDHTLAVEAQILLNLNEDDYSVHSFLSDSELAIEVAASLGNYLTSQNIAFGLVINGGSETVGSASDGAVPVQCLQLPRRKGREHLMAVLEALAAAKCGPAGDFSNLVWQEVTRLPWGATVLIVTPVDSGELVSRCFQLTRSGYKTVILVVGDKVKHSELLYRPASSSLQMYYVSSKAPQTDKVLAFR